MFSFHLHVQRCHHAFKLRLPHPAYQLKRKLVGAFSDSTNYCAAGVVLLRLSLATPVLSVWACLPVMCLCMFQNDSIKDQYFVLECQRIESACTP
jgi:hypothetical protein